MSECFIQATNSHAQHKCNDCGELIWGGSLEMIRDIQERLCPNEDVPSGQCPHCGALTYELEHGETEELYNMRHLDVNSLAVRKALIAHKKLHGEHALEAAYKMLSEEVGELLVAMNHHRRGRATTDKVCEEAGDVMLLLRLLAYILREEGRIEDVMDSKAERFGRRVLGLEQPDGDRTQDQGSDG